MMKDLIQDQLKIHNRKNIITLTLLRHTNILKL